MRKPIRVLFFIGDLTPGGSESHLVRLLLSLNRERIRPELMVLRALGSLVEVVRAAGIHVHEVGSANGSESPFRRLSRIRAAIRTLRPDIVHSYGYPCDVYTPLASLPRRGRRIVTSRRGNQEVPRVRMLYRLTNPFVDRVLCVSSATEQFAARTEGLSPARRAVIPNGIDLTTYVPRGEMPHPIRTIGTLGRIREVKGTDLLLDAFARLARPDLALRVGGPADTEWGVSFRAKNEGVRGVVFDGEIENVPPFLSSLDLFVLPSRSEGMSNALLEAMAAGLPIVATDVGSNREVLAEGEAGVLVNPDAASLAAGMKSVIDDPGRALMLGREARRRVEEEYTLDAMVQRYERFYEEIFS